MRIFTVSENTNLKDFTDCSYPQGSFCFSRLLRNKDIKVNGVRVRENIKVFAGDEIVYYTTAAQEAAKSHEVIYEDENFLVADKPSGVSAGGLTNELKAKGEYYAVHRLDRNTQGLIVFAKNAQAEKALLGAFKERKVKKSYIAVCKNAFKDKRGILRGYLLKDEKTATVRVYDGEVKGGASIVTEYSVEEDRGDTALVRIILHTGRTHQIRAHLAHIGCPVLGDEKYGDGALNKKYGAKRQRLVSKTLEFELGGGLAYINGRIFTSSFEL